MSVVYISEDEYDSEEEYDVKEEIIQNIMYQEPRTLEEVVLQVCQEIRQRKIIMGRYTMASIVTHICDKLKITRAL
jgi:hypothetical protein